MNAYICLNIEKRVIYLQAQSKPNHEIVLIDDTSVVFDNSSLISFRTVCLYCVDDMSIFFWTTFVVVISVVIFTTVFMIVTYSFSLVACI